MSNWSTETEQGETFVIFHDGQIIGGYVRGEWVSTNPDRTRLLSMNAAPITDEIRAWADNVVSARTPPTPR